MLRPIIAEEKVLDALVGNKASLATKKVLEKDLEVVI